MRLRHTLTTLALALALGVIAAAPAGARGSVVIQQCNNQGRLTSNFSVSQLRQALQSLPPDLSQYSDCADIIRRALDARLASTRAGVRRTSSSGGSFLPVWATVVVVIIALGGLGAAVAARRRPGGQRRA
jgi:hypothetical protein